MTSVVRPAVGRRRREVGAEVHDADVAPRRARRQRSAIPAELASTSRACAEPGADGARPRRAERARDGEDVAAVDGDDDGRAGARAADGVAGGRGVVGVDEVEGERAAQPPQREPRASAPPRRPSAP